MSAAQTQSQLAPQKGSGAMFDAIAHRYDLLNRVMSLGIDQRWRLRTVRALELASTPPDHPPDQAPRVLDVATGTADVALAIAHAHPGARIVGVDPSERMLEFGRKKVSDRGLTGSIELVPGDAQSLPFADGSFDATCIAFGIRNVPDRGRALREMARVTRTGGRVAVLELSEPGGGPLAALARFHIHTVVPRLGALLSGAPEYRYLQQSIAAFPPAREFAALMEKSDLEVLRTEPLTFGVCHLYVATPRRPR